MKMCLASSVDLMGRFVLSDAQKHMLVILSMLTEHGNISLQIAKRWLPHKKTKDDEKLDTEILAI